MVRASCPASQLGSNYHYQQADNQADTSVRTIRLILRYYQADTCNQADSSADNQADTVLHYQL